MGQGSMISISILTNSGVVAAYHRLTSKTRCVDRCLIALGGRSERASPESPPYTPCHGVLIAAYKPFVTPSGLPPWAS
jgi:hypothetical protein